MRRRRKINSNIKLFFYGLLSQLILFVGVVFMITGLVLWTFEGGLYFLIFIVGAGVGLYGKAMHFDYRRKSGYIVYHG